MKGERQAAPTAKKAAEPAPGADSAPARPSSNRAVSSDRASSSARAFSSDWDENRWWKREIEEMKKETKPAPGADRATKQSPSPAKAPVSHAPRPVETAAPRTGGNDWDENRWWKRELEDMKREREAKKPAAAAPKPARAPARPPLPARAPETRAPEARPIEAHASNGRVAENRVGDDDDGGFFRGGAM
jgi:hypothetical protein